MILLIVCPIVYDKGWLSYMVSVMMAVCCGLYLVLTIKEYRRQGKEQFVEALMKKSRGDAYDVLIAGVGCIVSYSLGYQPFMYFWLLLLFLFLLKLVF